MKPYYQDDFVSLYHGDCRAFLPTLRGDLVLTDPPYSHRRMDGGGFASGRKFYRDGALDGLNDFILGHYAGYLLQAAPMLIAFCSRDLIGDYAALAKSVDRTFDLHVWHKTNAIPFTANTWKSDVEYISLLWETKPGWVQLHQLEHSKVYTSPINQDRLHPAAKPIPLLSRYLQVLNAQLIIDPFAGSGTTLRAAKDLGRRVVGIEAEERYCEIAANRCRQEILFGDVA